MANGSVASLLRGFALAVALAGCASHSDRAHAIRSALDAGDAKEALKLVNEQLDVASEKDLPASYAGEKSLFLLDRAMILQQLERYELSSRDLEIADKQVEFLDLSRNAVNGIAKYMFSDDSGPYKAPPYEKLLINTENMVNYLSRGDLNGARIEARRLAVTQKYLKDHEDPAQALLGPGSYLAGFTFEKSGRADEALHYYDDALSYGEYTSLSEPVQRLMGQGGFSSSRLRSIAAKSDSKSNEDDGEILIIIEYGRVPFKIARRVPIGLALTYAADAISPTDRDRANYLAGQGLVTWVNYPELGQAQGTIGEPHFKLDGQAHSVEGIVAIDSEAKHAWDDAKGAIITAAITRMLTRAVTGEVVRHTTKNDLAGALLSLGVQATMTAVDTPDTRSWEALPARMVMARVRAKAGAHEVSLNVRGVAKKQSVTLTPGGFAVVAQTVLF